MLPIVVAGVLAAAMATYGVFRDGDGLLAAGFVGAALFLLGFAFFPFHSPLVLLGGALADLATAAVPGAWAWPWWQRGLVVIALLSVAMLFLTSPTTLGLDPD